MKPELLKPDTLRQRILEDCGRIQRGLLAAESAADEETRRKTIHRVTAVARRTELRCAYYLDTERDDLPWCVWSTISRASRLGDLQHELDMQTSEVHLALYQATKTIGSYSFDE